MGRLTDATRRVDAQTLSGVTLPAVNVTRRFDYDVAGHVVLERHEDVNGATKSLATQYYPSGALMRKHPVRDAGQAALAM